MPDTVEGQAILNNFTRTQRLLQYRDNQKAFDRILRGLPLYDTQLTEIVNQNNPETHTPQNLILRGECIAACAYLKSQNINVDLVYIDPPFASGADYAKKIYLRQNPSTAQKLNNNEEQILDIDELRKFEEKMYGDIWNKEDYLNWMYENLTAIKSIMSDNASIYVHLDWHIGHYVKILMDEVFGEDNFLNEIVWAYRSGGASKESAIARKHDSIYFYRKNDNFAINTIYERQYLEKSFMNSKQDDNGKFYVDTILTDTISGIINRVLPNGKIREYNTRPVLNLSAERLDYSTQKPEGLLSLLIEIATQKNMIVADFFGGSGVTAKVAHDLGRTFIHTDIGLNSIQTTRDRLSDAGASFQVMEVKNGVTLFRNPIQTMDKLKTLIKGLRNEDSLADFWEGAILDPKNGLTPVYLPNLLDHSTKVLDRFAINKIINEQLTQLPQNIKQVIIYYIDIDHPDNLNQFINQYNLTQIKIILRDLKEVLDEIVMNDTIHYKFTQTENPKLLNPDEVIYEVEITKFISDYLQNKINDYNQNKGLSPKNRPNNPEQTDDNNPQNTPKTKTTFKPIVISNNGLELIEFISLDCTANSAVWTSHCEIKIDKYGYVTLNGKKTKTFWNGKISTAKKPLRLKIRNIAGDETIIQLSEPQNQS